MYFAVYNSEVVLWFFSVEARESEISFTLLQELLFLIANLRQSIVASTSNSLSFTANVTVICCDCLQRWFKENICFSQWFLDLKKN